MATCNGKLVTGEARLSVWSECFEKLGKKQGVDFEYKIENLAPVAVEELDKPIELAEVEMAFKNLKSRKATGVDGICEMLKEGGQAMVETVWLLCCRAFALENIPKDWAKGIIRPCSKMG